MKEIRLSEWIGEGFYDIHRDIREGRHTHYWLKGGRGSGKSSFLSLEILLGLIADRDANAVVLRKVAANLRDSVFEQMNWAIHALGGGGMGEKNQPDGADPKGDGAENPLSGMR